MSDTEADQPVDHVEIAAGIVAAYVSKNSLPAGELPALLRSTFAAVTGLSGAAMPPAAEEPTTKPTTAQIKKSITPDALISFIDGKSYKILKRHLTAHGLDARSYRERFGLPDDYPVVAPSYAKRRSDLAKAIGLGRPGAMTEKPKAGKR